MSVFEGSVMYASIAATVPGARPDNNVSYNSTIHTIHFNTLYSQMQPFTT